MKKICFSVFCTLIFLRSYCWGFYMHEKINYHAVFLLPPPMMLFFKPNIDFLTKHAVDPDKRRYMVATEGAHHFMDIDHYGAYPFPEIPRDYKSAILKFSADTLQAYGIVPWWIQIMMSRLTKSFREKDKKGILKNAAELGHYIADAHVPLHICSNHNGQLTNQQGIHAFWESRIPELFAEKDWDFFIGKAIYIEDISGFIWKRVLESAQASDTVLKLEKEISAHYPPDQKYAFEERSGKTIKQYSAGYAGLYESGLNNMVERRMRQSIFAVSSCWYTAWVNAGQPPLDHLRSDSLTESELKESERMNIAWKTSSVKGRDCR